LTDFLNQLPLLGRKLDTIEAVAGPDIERSGAECVIKELFKVIFVSFDGGQLLRLFERSRAGSVWIDAENPTTKLMRGRVQGINTPIDDLIDACAQIRQF
jgi:hypothetical protein